MIFTRDTHQTDYMDTQEGHNLPVVHCVENTEGWELDKEVSKALLAKEGATFVNKPTFGSVKLAEMIKAIADKEETQVELVGLCTDICVLSNAVIAKASLPNAHIVVDAACCAGVTPESHDTALAAMKGIQVEVINQGQEPWR